MHVSPQLKTVAQVRAKALSHLHGIGHNRPDAQTPVQSLKAHFPQPEVAQIAEIQAQREAFENQRLELIEQRKQEILEKAKTLGYRVKQTEQNGQIRMVLVRTG